MTKTYVKNQKAGFNYEIMDKYHAGLELFGFEVKSIREGHGSLDGAYVIIRGGEAFLINTKIPPFQPKNTPEDYDPERPRKLLLNKLEIHKLVNLDNGKGAGLTIIPISLYSNGRNIKVEIAVAKGKKKQDKRESIKKRQATKEIFQELKRQR